jgi:hypothetical protein
MKGGYKAPMHRQNAVSTYHAMTAKGKQEANKSRTPEHNAYIKKALDGDYWPD